MCVFGCIVVYRLQVHGLSCIIIIIIIIINIIIINYRLILNSYCILSYCLIFHKSPSKAAANEQNIRYEHSDTSERCSQMVCLLYLSILNKPQIIK